MDMHGNIIRRLKLIEEPQIDNYDGCYLPNGDIIFISTATMLGVPCVYGNSYIGNLYRYDSKTKRIRRLTFDQEHNWTPRVLASGKVLFQRWEYTDIQHSNSRLLMSMNPDGTDQKAYYGSQSFFPNSLFYAKPIPGYPTKFVAIATGHHGVARAGRLLIFDVNKGQREAEGVVQEIPYRKKIVKPIVRDRLVDGVYPQFVHPYPINEKYFITSARVNNKSKYALYLVDTFDNMTKINGSNKYSLMEPNLIVSKPLPPIVPDRVNLKTDEATVFIQDIYLGEGLKGLPRGVVKKLRLFTYHFSPRNVGGLLGIYGIDGPWDMRRILGTVDVEKDGSAMFKVPATLPVAIQPLDENGKALALMRSWFTAMPGEKLSCIGCHERSDVTPPVSLRIATKKPVQIIQRWIGGSNNYSYAHEVQPIIDKNCIGCHDGAQKDGRPILNGKMYPNKWSSKHNGSISGKRPLKPRRFSNSYVALHRLVRRNGIEGGIHQLPAMEFHADSTDLVKMLKKGHYNVKLTHKELAKISEWIDMNAVYHGYWSDILLNAKKTKTNTAKAKDLMDKFSGVSNAFDYESGKKALPKTIKYVAPKKLKAIKNMPINTNSFPLTCTEAKELQYKFAKANNLLVEKYFEIGNNQKIKMVLIPPGEFIMGSANGHYDEQPRHIVKVNKAFYMSANEISNAQYSLFDPEHDSFAEVRHGYQFGVKPYPSNKPKQPVVRVSLNQIQKFCKWLSNKVGKKIAIPTEQQWEYACRAGSDTDFYFGNKDSDFSYYANLADKQLKCFAAQPYKEKMTTLKNPTEFDDWIPRNRKFDDHGFLAVKSGGYLPNAWGLYDMHGNVAEWTVSNYKNYIGNPNILMVNEEKVVRGGSWYDRPKHATSSYRVPFKKYQSVFDVGFRIIEPIN